MPNYTPIQGMVIAFLMSNKWELHNDRATWPRMVLRTSKADVYVTVSPEGRQVNHHTIEKDADATN